MKLIYDPILRRMRKSDELENNPTIAGDATLSTGNLKFGTAGKGIDFSVTEESSGAMGSELLDDYEEGTWTPTLYGLTQTAPDPTYSIQTGSYTKVGNLVTVTFECRIDVKGGNTSIIILGGLPFAVAERTTGYVNIINALNTGVYRILLEVSTSGVFVTGATASSTMDYRQNYETLMKDGSRLIGSITYKTT